MPDAAPIRRRVVYKGRVQGVGFRFTTAALARGFPVEGYVKNLFDGSVELVVDTDDKSFRQLDAAIKEAFDGYISDSMVEQIPSTEEFNGFSIRH